MRIIFNLYDVLFFKDSRPFNAGDAHLARTQPFVPPMTVTGAIRAALYSVNGEKYSSLINVGEEEPGFEVKGVFWCREKGSKNEEKNESNRKECEELFPLPRDIVSVKGDEGDELTVLTVHRPMHGYRVATANGRIHFSETGGYLPERTLIEYLKGELDDVKDISAKVIPTGEVFKRETRVGIRLEGSKTTVEGLLYRTENLRPERDIKVVAWVENDPNLEEGLKKAGAIRLGGEGHFAFIDVKNENPWKEIENSVAVEGDCIRLYVATPLIIQTDSGYTWDILKLNEVVKELAGVGVQAELVKAFVSKPVRIEGWDVVRKRPKKPRFAVLAGSVYYLKVKEGKVNPVMKLGELQNLGYGLVFAGNAKCDGG